MFSLYASPPIIGKAKKKRPCHFSMRGGPPGGDQDEPRLKQAGGRGRMGTRVSRGRDALSGRPLRCRFARSGRGSREAVGAAFSGRALFGQRTAQSTDTPLE